MATHVIQFPDKEKHKQAIVALLEVPVCRTGLPDYKMVVSDEHIQALKRAGIEFVDLTRTVPNGKTPLQS
jgi:hypothetical protein